MKPIAIIFALLTALAGCEQRQAESTVQAGVGVQVERLFTVDGCTVYRFSDFGIPRYFTNCSGSTQWQEGCGKNCTRAVGVSGGAR